MTRCAWILAIACVVGCSGRPEPAAPKAPAVAAVPSPSQDVEELVRDLLVEQLRVDRPAIDMNRPIGDAPLNADELDLVELVMEIEERLDVTIPDQELAEAAGAGSDQFSTRITPAQLAGLARKAQQRPAGKAK